MMNRIRALMFLLLTVVAAPAAAQRTPVAAGWHTLLTGEDGTVVSIDTATVERTGDSTFTVRTAVRFERPVVTASGDSVDREMGLEELDCVGSRARPRASEMYAGERRVLATLLSNEWAAVAPGRQAVFDATCAFLLGGFAATLRKGYDLSRVEEQPLLSNRAAVGTALTREYPRAMRAARQTGTVTLRFRVMEDGTVDRPSVSVMEFTHPDFAEAAVRVVYVMRFSPARIDRVPVPVWVVLPVVFRLSSGPARTQPEVPPAFPPLPTRP